jgi:hypothetical protein
MTLRTNAYALALLLLSACDGGVAIEDFPAENAEVVCTLLQDCIPSDLAGGADSFTNCTIDVEGSTLAALPNYEDLIARGVIDYDASAAADCIAATRDLGCDVTVSVTPAACELIFNGTTAIGSPCSLDDECAGEAFCAGANCPSTAGVCTERRPSGDDCTSDGQCVSGLACEAGTCRAPASMSGGACGGPGGLNCPLDEVCVGDNDATAGTCQTIESLRTGGEGDTCDPLTGESLCEAGLACALVGASATGMAMFECRPRASAGAACNLAIPNHCPDNQYCAGISLTQPPDFDGTCTALPLEGDDCLESEACASGLECVMNGEAATCTRLRDNGEACEVAGQCFSGSCVSGTCSAPELCTI